MAIEDIRSERLKKLELLKKHGIDPYPSQSNRTHENQEFKENFSSYLESQEKVTLAGRIMSWRGQGGIAFFDLYDGTERAQAVIKKDVIGEESFDLLQEVISVSDFLEVTGVPMVTKRGENSLLGHGWRMLSKSLNQVPDQWFGIKDEEERYRKRYLDMLLNQDTAELVRKRSLFWNSIRQFMLQKGFLEAETPILETKTGGAEAQPFVTHHNALDMEVYLRISPELWLKKLILAGFPKVFEIGRIFRNEGISHEHAQDYTHFEFYQAYLDGKEGVPMIIELYRHIARETFGTLKFSTRQFQEIDLEKDWDQYDFNQLIQENYGFDPRQVDLKTVKKHLDEQGIEYDNSLDIGRGVDALWKLIRKQIAGPAILTGIPVYLEPLAKKSKEDDRVVDRFQVLLGGTEMGKAFNELNDPLDQKERFDRQQALRDAGDDEAQMADYQYVEAMEYGMPPSFGFGISERLFSFMAGVPIREGQLFPLLRPKKEE